MIFFNIKYELSHKVKEENPEEDPVILGKFIGESDHVRQDRWRIYLFKIKRTM